MINNNKRIESDSIAMNIWRDKYRHGDEQCPEDTMDRIRNAFDKKIKEETSKMMFKKMHLLSPQGRQTFGAVANGMISEITRNTLDFDKCVPGGSGVYGIGNIEANSSISNCFVIDSPHDSLEGINYRINEMSVLEKARGGVGTNLSSLRPKGAHVNNQSKTSTGVVTFVIDFSQNNNIVAQDGRRGALMLCLDIDHPDVIDFIRLKSDLTKVTGANLSVLISDDFMKKVLKHEMHVMKFPINSPFKPSKDQMENTPHMSLQYDEKTKTYWKIEHASTIWNEIIHYAWAVAEPGVLFKDNWYKYGTDGVYDEYRPVATNPCSEIAMQPYDSCRLMSYNLMDCVQNPFTDKASINYERLYKMCYNQMFLTDIMIDIEIDHINNIIRKISSDMSTPNQLKTPVIELYNKILSNTKRGRRCGCGFIGLGDVIVSMGYNFSDMSKNGALKRTIREIFRTKRNAELDASIDLAVMYGSSFAGFDFEIDSKQEFFKEDTVKMKEILTRMRQHGRRNVSFSTAAPTGTISILAGVTSGIEPLFMPFYIRRVKIDGTSSDKWDYEDADGNRFIEYPIIHPGLVHWYSVHKKIDFFQAQEKMLVMKSEELQKVFEQSPYFGQTANDIDKKDRIALQEMVQKYTTHSISSTLNLPAEATEQEISDIYIESWRHGLKGNTVYRDGCRGGVLVSMDKKKDKTKSERPDIIKGVLHKLQYKKDIYGIVIGLVDEHPYEIFIMSQLADILKNTDKEIFYGNIVRNKKTDGSVDYDFIEDVDEDETPFAIYDLDAAEDRENRFQSLTLSRLMRKGDSMDEIVKIINKSEPLAGTFNHRLCKILYGYKETQDDDVCPNCGTKLSHENGCVICKNCGWSKC